MIKQTSRNLKGAVLSLVTLMIAILMIVGVVILKIGTSAKITSVYAASEISARAAADAGLSHALTLMNQKVKDEYSWDSDTLPTGPETLLPNCQATYNFQILGDISDGYEIVSTGTTNLAEKTVSSTLKLKGLFDYAIFAEDGINRKMGTTVAGYNYGPEDPILQLGTNSIEEAAMSMKNGVTVLGDVIVGPGGDIDFAIDSRHEAEITGSVVVKHFTKNVAADFHYDSSLSNVSIDDFGVKFVVDRWQE